MSSVVAKLPSVQVTLYSIQVTLYNMLEDKGESMEELFVDKLEGESFYEDSS